MPDCPGLPVLHRTKQTVPSASYNGDFMESASSFHKKHNYSLHMQCRAKGTEAYINRGQILKRALVIYLSQSKSSIKPTSSL